MASQENTNFRTPNPSNPSSLKPRYEIRKLEPCHTDWALAIVTHSNLLHGPLWSKLYPDNVTERLHRSMPVGVYLVEHQINSGLSFGVFDTEYVFKREESRATGGKLYWDEKEPGVQEEQGRAAEGKRLLEQMDFPLVSIALAYDAWDKMDMAKLGPLIDCMPHFKDVYTVLGELDTRDPNPAVPTKANEVMYRNATSTRHDYEGEGCMGGLARWLMREADARGFRAIQIESVNDGVEHVWSKPPAPYKGTVVAKFNAGTYVDKEGRKVFEPAVQSVSKIYVDLQPQA